MNAFYSAKAWTFFQVFVYAVDVKKRNMLLQHDKTQEFKERIEVANRVSQ